MSWLVEPFRYDKPLTAAFQDVKTVIAAYPPGQRGIDGGGFKVVKESVTASSGYVYVQFESRRKGYIDDFEVLLSDGRGEQPTFPATLPSLSTARPEGCPRADEQLELALRQAVV